MLSCCLHGNYKISFRGSWTNIGINATFCMFTLQGLGGCFIFYQCKQNPCDFRKLIRLV